MGEGHYAVCRPSLYRYAHRTSAPPTSASVLPSISRGKTALLLATVSLRHSPTLSTHKHASSLLLFRKPVSRLSWIHQTTSHYLRLPLFAIIGSSKRDIEAMNPRLPMATGIILLLMTSRPAISSKLQNTVYSCYPDDPSVDYVWTSRRAQLTDTNKYEELNTFLVPLTTSFP